MPKSIIWSPLAEDDFDKILDYLDKNWNEKVISRFIDITEKVLIQISINPKQYPLVYPLRKIRKCVLTKHNSIFYREQKKQIQLLRIYDTRQDLNKLEFV